jgi:hypothetical protein
MTHYFGVNFSLIDQGLNYSSHLTLRLLYVLYMAQKTNRVYYNEHIPC